MTESEESLSDQAPIIRVLNVILERFLEANKDRLPNERFTSVHIVPEKKRVVLRYEDQTGEQYEIAPFPKHINTPLVDQIKRRAGIPIEPKFEFEYEGHPIEVMVKLSYTPYGEQADLSFPEYQSRIVPTAPITTVTKPIGKLPEGRFRGKQIGEILLEKNILTKRQLNSALKVQQNSERKLGEILVEKGYTTEERVLEAYAGQKGLLYISNVRRASLDPVVASTLPKRIALKLKAVLMRREGQTLYVAMVDPTNVFALDDLRLTTGCEIVPYLVSERTYRGLARKAGYEI